MDGTPRRVTLADCQSWMTDRQLKYDSERYGANRRAVDDQLAEQLRRQQELDRLRADIDRCSADRKDDQQTEAAESAFTNIKSSVDIKLQCLQTAAQIDKLENLFGPLVNEFAQTSVDLKTAQKGATQRTLTSSTANSLQQSILAVGANWDWIGTLLRCTETQLQHAAEYHKFYSELAGMESWMLADLERSTELLTQASIQRHTQAADAGRILFDIKTALTLFLHWRSKIDAIFQRSKAVLPIQLRTTTVDHELPVKALANYVTNEITILKGEELTLLDNSKAQMWQVRNLRAQTSLVPSPILVILGPDPEAVDAAFKLRLQLLGVWTRQLKRYGRTLLWFLLQLIRDWTDDERKMLRALSAEDKQNLLSLLDSIRKTFSPVWDNYHLYQTLQDRCNDLRQLLKDETRPEDNGAELGRLLVIQTDIVEELLAKYREYWQQWIMFKILTETVRHPEFLLVADKWEDYSFLQSSEWFKKWLLTLDFDDLEALDGLEVPETAKQTESEAWQNEVYRLQKEKETSETAHVMKCEVEENQTFVITGVIDPRTGEEISLDQAVAIGVINQTEGRYVNPVTRESMPIPVAMNAGKIKVELTTVKKSEEKRSDIGLITIKTTKECRPFTVRAVIDAKTEQKLSPEEAAKAGLLDQKRGVYVNKLTHEEISLTDAYDSGLLIVDFDQSTASNGEVDEVVTKTYAVRAVVDVKNKARRSFRDALDAGLIDVDKGSYFNNQTNEVIYVGDAIRKGLIKASVVRDASQLEQMTSPGNVVTVADSTLAGFRTKMASPLVALSALKRAGRTDATNGTH